MKLPLKLVLIAIILSIFTSCFSMDPFSNPLSVFDVVRKVNSEKDLLIYKKKGLSIPRYSWSDQETLLLYAAMEKPHLMPMLINEGISSYVLKSDSFLINAALYPDIPSEVFRICIESGAKVNLLNEKDGTSILSRLLFAGHPYETIKAFIDAGADVTKRDSRGLTPFLYAMSSQRKTDLRTIKLLTEKGSDPFVRILNGKNALMLAIESNQNLDIIGYLLELGFRVDDTSTSEAGGYTPITAAAMHTNSPELISFLYQHGASWDRQTNAEISPLVIGLMHNPSLQVLMELMVYEGIELAYLHEYNFNMLMVASTNPNPAVMAVLIELGYDDIFQNSAGMYDVNFQNSAGMSVLMRTAEFCVNPDMITLLLDTGADPKLKDKDGKTVLDYAMKNEKLKDTEVFWRLVDASFK